MDSKIEKKILAVPGYRLAFIEAGVPARPPLLFLHGFMGDGLDWQPVMQALAEAYHCIALDLPGHGATEIDNARLCSMPACADAIRAFLEKRRLQRVVVAGYSMGGRLALYLVVHFPDHFTAAILESASPGLKTAEDRRARRRWDAGLAEELETGDFAAFLQRWYDQPLFAGIRSHPNFAAMLQRRLRNAPAGLANSLRYMGTGRQPGLWHRLPQVPVPVLLISGGRDRRFVDINREMAALLPLATHEVIRDAGHNVHFEQPALFSQVVRSFLQPTQFET